MLQKLQALTNNFTCQNCWQVLNFARFFDEEHECLKKVIIPVYMDQVLNSLKDNSIEQVEECIPVGQSSVETT